MELVSGRPATNDGRLDKEIRVYDLLDRLNVEYKRIDHMPADTMEICAEIDKVLDAIICKNLFLCNRQKTDFYLLMIPGDKVFKTKDITSQLGCSRLSFAGSEFMEEFLDIKPGAVSVLGLMNDKDKRVRLVIDKPVIESEYFGCHPCVNTSSLKIKVDDLMNVILPALEHEATIVELPVYEEENEH